MVRIIDGKKIADSIYSDIKKETQQIKKKYKKTPHLAVILVGDNPASQIYVKIKERRSQETGMKFSLLKFNTTTSEKKVIDKIEELNKSKTIHGFIVQLPLPKKFNEKKIIQCINPDKDVDGLHPINLGNLVQNEEVFVPCTPAGTIELIKSTSKNLSGLKAVIVGRSNIVGKPISFLLLKEHCTVTICHSRTKKLPSEVKNADILVAAIGQPEFIKGNWIKKNAIVIDVGINRIDDKTKPKGYRIVGDVEFNKAKQNASFITPVPGGVGPMTVALLLKNTLKAFYKQNKIKK